MNTPFLAFNVRNRRDVVLARDWSRQVAALLGFEPLEQACIAALAFEIARQAREKLRQTTLQFQVDGDIFQIFAVLPDEMATLAGLRLEKRLPNAERKIALEDVAWVVCQMAEQSPASLYQEIERQNQELLHALSELQGCRAKMPLTDREPDRPAA